MVWTLLMACAGGSSGTRVEPTFLDVKLGAVETGTAADPLPFSAAATPVPLSVRALDASGEAISHTGPLALTVRPGHIVGTPSIDMVDGQWEGTVNVAAPFGPTRLWASDEDTTDGRTAAWSSGVSGPLTYALPTIREMQTTLDHETNNLAGEYAEIRVGDRQAVVTALDAAGFWITDIADPPGSFGGLFVYTFSKPPDEIVLGARLTSLTGINQEYLASTQFSFPTLTVAAGESFAVPDAVVLDAATACDDLAMEALEASRVRAENAMVPATFLPDSEDFADFEAYGQWPLQIGTCTVYVESGTTVPSWYPPDHAGAVLAHVEGMLKEVYGKWIFVVLTAEGIDGAPGGPVPVSRNQSRSP